MNKKAQFYILAAVLLIAVTFGLFTTRNPVSAPDRTLQEIADNYMKEAPFAANTGNLHDFTLKFYDFAVQKEPAFEMLYIFSSSGNISAFSLIKSTIFINQYSLSFNNTASLSDTQFIVSIGAEQYNLNITENGLRAIFISRKKDSTNVIIR